MPESAEQIRALYRETLAAAFCPYPWERATDKRRQRSYAEAGPFLDALTEAGLLPTGIESRYIGRGMLRRWRYVGDWHDPEGAE